MPIKDAFRKNISGTTLINLVGNNDATLEGSPLPTIISNYINFSGGNGGSPSPDYSRVNLVESDYEFTNISQFTIMIYFKSSKNDSNIHTLFSVTTDTNTDTGKICIYIDDSNTLHFLLVTDSFGNAYKECAYMQNVCDGKWHLATLTYQPNDLKCYFDTIETDSINNDEINSGNFYSSSQKACLGVWYNGSDNYLRDFTGGIALFNRYDNVLSHIDIISQYAYLQCHYS